MSVIIHARERRVAAAVVVEMLSLRAVLRRDYGNFSNGLSCARLSRRETIEDCVIGREKGSAIDAAVADVMHIILAEDYKSIGLKNRQCLLGWTQNLKWLKLSF